MIIKAKKYYNQMKRTHTFMELEQGIYCQLQKGEYSFSKVFVCHFSRESVRNRVKSEVSHLYRNTIDEKEKQGKKLHRDW